jgi:hypothetical protein
MLLAVKNEPQPSASNGTALMSNWSPDDAAARPETKTENATENGVSSPVRLLEYQADVRSADGLSSPWQK